MDKIPPVRHTLIIGIPVDLAFDLFTDEIGMWWPIAFTFSLSAFCDARMEAREGGAWFEMDNHGNRRDWGRVLTFDRPNKLILSFAVNAQGQVLPDEKASELELRFAAENVTQARLDLEHRNFGKMGAGATAWREHLASANGWPVILASFARHARNSSHIG